MKKFVFSLKPQQTVTENAEKQKKMQLKAIESQWMDLQQEVACLELEYDKQKEAFCEAVLTGIEANRAMQFGEYFLKLKATKVQKERRMAKLDQEKTDCLEALVNIRREMNVLEKLRQSEYEEYKRTVKKEQNKAVEDFFSYKVVTS